MKRLLLAVVVLIGCSPTEPVKAKRWTTAQLVEGAEKKAVFGGLSSASLVTFAGKPMPFTNNVPASVTGWSVLPAYAEAKPAAYVITELWENHPDPWIQPVYLLATSVPLKQRAKIDANKDGLDVPPTFGVGEDSTFYSPFWQAIFVKIADPVPNEGLPDTRAMLRAALEIGEAAKPLCPITPKGFTIAASQADNPIHPITGAPIKQRYAGLVRVDGYTPSYIDFGLDKFEVTQSGVVIPTRIFFFTRIAGGERTLLPVPAVLAANAKRSGYARRYDVVLDKETIFVPAGSQWDWARASLQQTGDPEVDPKIPAADAAAYALRVAKDSKCFKLAANFPAGCDWLDSEAAIDRLEPRNVNRTDVTVTAVPVLFDGEQL